MLIHSSLSPTKKEAEMTSKESHDQYVSSSTTPTTECCMCGDHGLFQELFRCRICLFRFQHRYCSNLYPKAGTYRVCNWCLNKRGNKIERTQSSSSVSVTYSNNTAEDEGRRHNNSNGNTISHVSSMKVRRGGSSTSSHLLVNNKPIKKQPIHSDESIGRKKTASRSQESLRRTKSEVTVSSGMIKQVFRGRVQRYKLLEEVSIK